MSHRLSSLSTALAQLAFACAVVLLVGQSALLAQDGPAQGRAAPSGGTTVALTPSAPVPADNGPYRRLAPGVETCIAPHVDTYDTVSRHDLVEVLTADPNYGERAWSQGRSPAKNFMFRHNVWALEFCFKPVRFVTVDVPDDLGRMERKLVWYMVYRVQNTGQHPVRFVPEFLLESRDTQKVYPDRLIPAAVPVIQRREDPHRKLLTTAEIAGVIEPSAPGEDGSVWGVAMWEYVDPHTDYFSVYVQGLTNAYRWVDPPGAYKAGDPPAAGRKTYRKTLMLNFWRPGDAQDEDEAAIRFGFHQPPDPDRLHFKDEEKVDYAWVYR